MKQDHRATSNVLVVGCYLTEKPSNIVQLSRSFKQSAQWKVIQRWAALGKKDPPSELLGLTVKKQKILRPKFEVINELLAEELLNEYEYVIVSDDDILLPTHFLDNYLRLVKKYDFCLAQPARSLNSFNDHDLVWQIKDLQARQTRFVEIGPIFSMRKDIYDHFLPFDLSSPMGWGYDFTWPCIVEELGLRMGIVDSTPVDHSLREPVINYSWKAAEAGMKKYLSGRRHLSEAEAHTILESYKIHTKSKL
jgi:hypothetical protein